MPVSARRSPKGGYNIVEKATGKVVGHSSTKAKATASARVRNAVRHGFRPTGKGRRR